MWASIGMWLFQKVVLGTAQREADRAGVDLFSVQNGLAVRQKMIAGVLLWLDRVDKTRWGKKIKTDDQAKVFWKTVMKSDTIGQTVGEKSLADVVEGLNKVRGILYTPYTEMSSLQLMHCRQGVDGALKVLESKNLSAQPPAGSST